MKHKHHIIPRYAGGSNYCENLVELTPIQHAMYHYADWRRKGDKRDYLDWKCLSGQIDNAELQTLKSRLGYEKMQEKISNRPHPGTKLKGRKQTEEHKANRSKALKGRVCCSPEATARMAETKRKLTEEQVREIRASKEKGVILAAKYGVVPSLISRVRNRKSYTHIM